MLVDSLKYMEMILLYSKSRDFDLYKKEENKDEKKLKTKKT